MGVRSPTEPPVRYAPHFGRSGKLCLHMKADVVADTRGRPHLPKKFIVRNGRFVSRKQTKSLQ